MPERGRSRRKALLFVGGTLAAIAFVLVIAARNAPRAFPELYELGPQVIEYNPDLAHSLAMTPISAPKTGIIATSGRRAVVRKSAGVVTTRSRLLVFPASKMPDVRAAFSKRFHADATYTAYPFTLGSNGSNYGTSYFDGKMVVNFTNGEIGDEMAGLAGATQPPGGCVVTITEPADWLTRGIDRILRSMHLR